MIVGKPYGYVKPRENSLLFHGGYHYFLIVRNPGRSLGFPLSEHLIR
jgi:hypothetical protein